MKKFFGIMLLSAAIMPAQAQRVLSLDSCRQRYDVYKDIRDTYAEISQGDYIGKLVEEERKRKEQEAKKRKKKL